ncbi:hypothetical protein HU200_000788 [Digitaria exilis]|uniref:Bifunctional inhibitor/plant lipid transfer protein/seed storage helical domain-containing protein n=1 Tax=Digitaria exilis TaxID=1010633 RepID=A0A835G1U5_9POAL|nr:hypothetical protein HU200_000788 [Digitaria exilis]
MMTTRGFLQVLVFGLVFTMFTIDQTWGEPDCYREKALVREHCMESITIKGDYVRPSEACCHMVDQSDMTCICHNITLEDEKEISVAKFLWVAIDCDKPVESGTECGSKYLYDAFL